MHDAFNAQELLAIIGEHAQQTAAHIATFTGIIKTYDPKLGVVVTLQPESIDVGPMPLLTPWGGAGYGEQSGPPKGMPVTVQVLDGPDQSSFICLGGHYTSVDKPPTFSYNGNTVTGAQQGEWLVVHAKTGTYMWLGNDSILHLGGQSEIEILSPLTVIGDLKANLDTTKNSAARQEDLQALVNYINNTLLPAIKAITVPTGTGPSGVPINAASFTNAPTATGSSVVLIK